VDQSLALSPILSILYIAFILHILEKYLKVLNIPIFILSFVDDSLLVSLEQITINFELFSLL